MASLPLAPLSALEARLGVEEGSLEGVDKARAEAALEDASADVREEARRSFLDSENQPNPPEPIRRIVLAVAKRMYQNPDGWRSETNTVGPYTEVRTRGDAELSSGLTEAEAEVCARYRPQSSGLWTQGTTRNEYQDSTGWMWDSYGTPIPVNADVDRWWL